MQLGSPLANPNAKAAFDNLQILILPTTQGSGDVVVAQVDLRGRGKLRFLDGIWPQLV
jgi:hypothetical protein